MDRRHRAMVAGVLESGASPTYIISGTVYDADGSTAVASATVALGALSVVSAADGTYTISDVPAGTSGSMTCTKAGYSWTPITVAAMSGNLTTQNYINAWWAAAGIAASCQRAYKAIGAASLAASYLNLVNPGTGDAAEGVAPTFDAATGWTGTGTQYLRTGITTAVGINWTMLVRYSNAQNFSVVFGTATAGKRWNANPVQNTTMRLVVGASANDVGTNQASGVIGSVGTKAYFNGAFVADLSSTANVTSDELYILGYNNGGSLGGGFNGKIQAFALYNTVLTAPQVAAVSAAMASLP